MANVDLSVLKELYSSLMNTIFFFCTIHASLYESQPCCLDRLSLTVCSERRKINLKNFSFIPSPREKPVVDVVNVDFLEKKVKSLEDENLHLRLEVSFCSCFHLRLEVNWFCLSNLHLSLWCCIFQGSFRLWNSGKTMEFRKRNSIYGKTMEFEQNGRTYGKTMEFS